VAAVPPGRDSGSVDAGVTSTPDVDAGLIGPAQGDVLSVPDLEWQFVTFPQTRCANDKPTGLGVNLNRASDELVLYLRGGGACWNAATCSVGISKNIRTGYDSDDFKTDDVREWVMFSRQEMRNPFREMNFAIVPYCTGDVHAGTRTASYDAPINPLQITHAGARNVEAFLPKLAATLPRLRRILVVGSSAGGFGAQLNFPRIVETFPGVTIDVLADSAQLVNPQGGLVDEWVRTWGVQIPLDCVGCATDFPKYLEYLLAKYPSTRFGLLVSMRDVTLTPFFNYGVDSNGFQAATADLLTAYNASPNATYLARDGLRHTFMEHVKQLKSNTDQETFEWVTQFVARRAPRKGP
jgi:hypothetical protein